MKTYKQKYQEAMKANLVINDAYSKLRSEYTSVIMKAMENTTIKDVDISLMQYLVDGLEDIRKNGGAYSSVKAVELLLALGKL